MGARGNKSAAENPAAIIEREYSDDYFARLGEQFRIDFGDVETRREVRTIGRLYLILNRMDGGQSVRLKDKRHFAWLAKETKAFLDILRHGPREDIAFALYMTALGHDAPMPTTKFPDLDAHAQNQSGEPYLLELIRLLELLEKSMTELSGRLRVQPGPKINSGLELLVRRTADYFISRLKRPFSVDHHKPVAASEAFDFVHALVTPLDNISDTEIITAIRAEQNKRRTRTRKA